MKFKSMRPFIAVFLTLLFVGCSSTSLLTPTAIVAEQTISTNSKWINSEVEGAILPTTKSDLKDDFFTSVNKDWILQNKLGESEMSISNFSLAEDIVLQRKIDILRGSSTTSLDDELNYTNASQLEHNIDLIQQYSKLASDWDTRNALGIEPALKYLQAIENISSLADMTAYLNNENGLNFTQAQLIPMSVEAPFSNRDYNTVLLSATPTFSLSSQDNYKLITPNLIDTLQANNAATLNCLQAFGYTESEALAILRSCYEFEGKLAANMMPLNEQSGIAYLSSSDNSYTYDELSQIQGNYPLTQLLETYGLNTSNRYTVAEPEYVKAVGKLYNESNLESMKNYFLVITANNLSAFLDRDLFETTYQSFLPESSSTTHEDDEETNLSSDEEILLDFYVKYFFAEPLEIVYISLYCSEKQKQDILDLIDTIKGYYAQMLQETDWLSNETRIAAIEKLESIAVRAVYPDSFTDYSGLDLSKATNLVDAMALITDFEMHSLKKDVNAPVDSTKWNLNDLPTTTVNAYYMPTENSINIFAGLLSQENFYSEDMAIEELYASIGSIIGHEITHAFDTTGRQFDKNGYLTNWWNTTDIVNFQDRVRNLTTYYALLTPLAGIDTYTVDVSGEAIADFGAVKCMLGLAKAEANFDYDKFFKAYAALWRNLNVYDYEAHLANADPHPLAFLRVNVTLQQFDEFLETYNIKEGDGMYLAPKNRILVW